MVLCSSCLYHNGKLGHYETWNPFSRGLPLAGRSEDGREALSTRGGIQRVLFRLRT